MRVNVGCGRDIRAGFVNMDILPLPGVDVVHDMMRTPWPFEDSSVSEIVISHVLEHIPHHHASGRDGFLVFMEELFRVLEPGGVIVASLPHHKNRWGLEVDPTHTRVILPDTWAYFHPDDEMNWYTHARFVVDKKWTSRYQHPRLQPFSYLAWRLPFMRKFKIAPSEITYRLRCVKPTA